MMIVTGAVYTLENISRTFFWDLTTVRSKILLFSSLNLLENDHHTGKKKELFNLEMESVLLQQTIPETVFRSEYQG